MLIQSTEALPEGYDEQDITAAVASMVLQIVVRGSSPGQQKGTVDPDAAMEGVIMAVASLLEQAQEFQTPQKLRRASEYFGKRLTDYARGMRKIYDDTGIHPIDQLMERYPSSPGERH